MTSVTCVCLYADRPRYLARVMQSFRAQTYPAKDILFFDTGLEALNIVRFQTPGGFGSVRIIRDPTMRSRTIGDMRNTANSLSNPAPIIAHWDSDDWSAPERLAEQVAILEANPGLEATGYRECLFFRETDQTAWIYRHPNPRYCLGASLCYWRSVWERHPFEALPKTKGGTGEDTQWLRGVISAGATAIPESGPRMVCAIHGSNSGDYSGLGTSDSWKRVPEWDERCRKIMEQSA